MALGWRRKRVSGFRHPDWLPRGLRLFQRPQITPKRSRRGRRAWSWALGALRAAVLLPGMCYRIVWEGRVPLLGRQGWARAWTHCSLTSHPCKRSEHMFTSRSRSRSQQWEPPIMKTEPELVADAARSQLLPHRVAILQLGARERIAEWCWTSSGSPLTTLICLHRYLSLSRNGRKGVWGEGPLEGREDGQGTLWKGHPKLRLSLIVLHCHTLKIQPHVSHCPLNSFVELLVLSANQRPTSAFPLLAYGWMRSEHVSSWHNPTRWKDIANSPSFGIVSPKLLGTAFNSSNINTASMNTLRLVSTKVLPLASTRGFSSSPLARKSAVDTAKETIETVNKKAGKPIAPNRYQDLVEIHLRGSLPWTITSGGSLGSQWKLIRA